MFKIRASLWIIVIIEFCQESLAGRTWTVVVELFVFVFPFPGHAFLRVVDRAREYLFEY